MSSITDELIAGTAAGFASTILGAPLDAVKVRMQHLQQPGELVRQVASAQHAA